MDGAGLRRSEETQADTAAGRIDCVARPAHAQPRVGSQISRSSAITPLRVFPALVLLLTCCDRASAERLGADADVGFPPRDTIRCSLPAATQPCSARRSFT